MFSGAYPCKLVEDVVFCVEGKSIPEGGPLSLGNIGEEWEKGISGEQDCDDQVTMVINVVYTHHLSPVPFDKDSFKEYIKAYLARVKGVLEKEKPDRVATFMKGSQMVIKKVLSNFGDYSFYQGESMEENGGIVMMVYKEDGVTPCFNFFRDGLVLGFPGFGKSVTKEALVPAAIAQREGFVI
jgi:Translationally controlled tumour protein